MNKIKINSMYGKFSCDNIQKISLIEFEFYAWLICEKKIGIIQFEKLSQDEYNKLKSEFFFTELEQLLRKHNISISHEDKHGSFIIEEFNENNMNWLKDALINKEK